MCGRFSLTTPIEALRKLFGFSESPNLFPRYNIAPSTPIAAVRKHPHPTETGNQLFFPRWGLIPSWAKDSSLSARMINARMETVSEKPAFRGAFKAHRCLIPVTGFYEWKTEDNGQKQPYFIHQQGQETFALAGLWERWQSPDNDLVESCTILTMPAAGPIRALHHRMPVTVQPDLFGTWLSGNDRDSLPGPARQIPLACYPVSNKVGNVQNDSPDLMNPVSLTDKPQAPKQQALF
ncbi:SOS response-associated peptidase [Sneathiella chinensis]|nr:SOS response-associated peptidase [Sneathiella chinensis]